MVPSQFSESPPGDRVCVLFPGALGDFLCFAESLPGLGRRASGGVTIVARPAWTGLLDARRVRCASIDGAAVAELFGSAPLNRARELLGGTVAIYSFTGAGDPGFARQLESLGRRVGIFPFRAFRAGEHASEYYARCLDVIAEPVEIHIPDEARAWAGALVSSLPSPLLAVHAGSGSSRKNWAGFVPLVDEWRRRHGGIVEIRGPAEEGGPSLAAAHVVVREELPRVAALLEIASLYVGNDSGITHLAAANGVRGLALFGSGETIHWRPRSSALRVVQATETCSACATLCTHQLSIAAVLAELSEVGGGARGPAQPWQRGQ